MNYPTEIEGFTRNPELLLSLIREVIEHLKNENDKKETKAMEAQLREISKAIVKLEKLCVAIPDPLRAEKTRLAASLTSPSVSIQALMHLKDGLDQITKDLKPKNGRPKETLTKKTVARNHSKSPKTNDKILRELIEEAVRHFGGSATKNAVIKYIGKKLEGKLLTGDLEWRKTANQFVWQNNVCWERYAMIQGGILKKGSPRGMWELNE